MIPAGFGFGMIYVASCPSLHQPLYGGYWIHFLWYYNYRSGFAPGMTKIPFNLTLSIRFTNHLTAHNTNICEVTL